MKRIILAVILFSVASLSFGCKPTLDTSSEESLKTSAEKVKNSLPKEKQDKFEEAMVIIVANRGMKAALSGGDGEKKVKEVLNGKTGDEVIAEAEKIKAEK